MFNNYSIVDMINAGMKPSMIKMLPIAKIKISTFKKIKTKRIFAEHEFNSIYKPSIPLKQIQNSGSKLKSVYRKSKPYYKKVWIQTELSAPFLKDIEKRSWKGKHIEHIVPISYGEKYNIPPYLIGSIDNLMMLDRKDNMRKGARLTIQSKKLLKKWGYEVPNN